MDQMQGQVEMVPANNATDIKDPYFKEEYEGHEIPAHEQHLFHVVQESRTFKTVSTVPEKLSKALLQKYTPAVFHAMEKAQGFVGQVVHILHNPEAPTAEGGNAAPNLTSVNGIGEAKAKLLVENQVATLEKLASLTEDEIAALDAVDGLTANELAQWVQDAKALLPK